MRVGAGAKCKQLIIRSLFWFEPHRALQQIKDQDIGDNYDDDDDDDDDDNYDDGDDDEED